MIQVQNQKPIASSTSLKSNQKQTKVKKTNKVLLGPSSSSLSSSQGGLAASNFSYPSG